MRRPELRLKFVAVARTEIGLEVLGQDHRKQVAPEICGIAVVVDQPVRALTDQCVSESDKRTGANGALGNGNKCHGDSIAVNAFASTVDLLFADPNIGRDAVYIADGGTPVLVRVVARRADAVTRIDLRVVEVPAPRPGDRIEIEGDAFLIQGEPVRDRERLVWTVDLRPA
jgi:hypothetical protein